MVRKLVSHREPRHLDDWLSLLLLRKKYPEAQVEYVSPQGVPGEYAADPGVVLVDVGGVFDPALRNYDHHQDPSLPCSLVLVLENEKPLSFPLQVARHPAVKFVDLSDRYGVKKASAQTGVPLDREVDELRKTLLLLDPAKVSPGEAERIAELFEDSLLESRDFNEWMRTFYDALDREGLLEPAKKRKEEEERRFREKLERAKVVEEGGLRILYLPDDTFAPYHYRAFSETGADLIVERNSQNPSHTSVIKNTASPKTQSLDLSLLFSDYPKVFLHQTGFIAVVDASPEEVRPERVAEILAGPSPSPSR